MVQSIPEYPAAPWSIPEFIDVHRNVVLQGAPDILQNALDLLRTCSGTTPGYSGMLRTYSGILRNAPECMFSGAPEQVYTPDLLRSILEYPGAFRSMVLRTYSGVLQNAPE